MTKVTYRIQYVDNPMKPPNPKNDPIYANYNEEHKKTAINHLNSAKKNHPQLEFYMAVKIETISVVNEGDLL